MLLNGKVQARSTDPSSSWQSLLLGLVNLPASKTFQDHVGRKGRVKDLACAWGQGSYRHGQSYANHLGEEEGSLKGLLLSEEGAADDGSERGP